jgi:hypothetical protein
MRDDDGVRKHGRRAFIRSLGKASTVAALAAVAAPLGTGEAAAAESEAERKKARYRETDHVKAYYRTNRY